jgi:hypothetical protein
VVLLITQVASSLIVAVKVDVVVVVAEEGPTDCRRQAAVNAPVKLNRERSFDMVDMKSLPAVMSIKYNRSY